MGYELTKRQSTALDFIKAFIAENNTAPTVREIAAGVGEKSTSGAHRLIAALETRGRIKRLKGKARAMKIITETEN